MDFLGVIFFAAVAVALFLLSRTILLWYWKVDEMFGEIYEIKKYLSDQIELQKEILEALKDIKGTDVVKEEKE